mmetsp:Transcript_72/g.129  ORF Transcript_72/g.129 Transcript_72/m.129 type:complete len:312 (+) Transcript_72:68-1003(+)
MALKAALALVLVGGGVTLHFTRDASQGVMDPYNATTNEGIDIYGHLPSFMQQSVSVDVSDAESLPKHVSLALQNAFIPFVVIYGSILSLLIAFAEPLKSRKLSGVPIDFRFLLTEIRRCCNSLALLALWDLLLTRSGAVRGVPGAVVDLRQSLLYTLPLTLLWADLHFYAIHRFLHSHPFLYKHIHKIHHESVNTNVMSGLSFHPVEGFLYFSSLLFCVLLPGGMSRFEFAVFKIGLLLAPIGGHHGYSLTNVETGTFDLNNCEHYTHHVKFNYNYGSGLFPKGRVWDYLLGTVWDVDRPISKRLKVAKKA